MENDKIYLSESEVYQLTGSVIHSISEDLNRSIYKKLDGKLTIVWRESESFNASAQILNKISEPPNHRITINYGLVKELYQDVIHYHEFAENIHYQPAILSLLNSITEMPTLPKCFNKKESINNMFMACLTFIFFHELGHLMQQHARIRATFSEHFVEDFMISECEANNSTKLIGKQAAISHTTELAADFSAVTRCISELFRHFSDEEIVGKDHGGIPFLGAVQLFVSGISCLFYRFRGFESSHLETVPCGSHPFPLIRLELNLPHIYEMLSFPIVNEIMGCDLDRKKIVELVTRAAYSGAYFWLVRAGDHSQEIPKNYIFKGILNSDESKKYTSCIIQTWDEIEDMIDSYNLDELPLTKITFTDQIRELIQQ
ncbi:hypothetical protein [Acinetobacter nosocomialis]|uniref:hypothetical protein n=1 Tax=Acinetobacter nosocomialis TaxID=106654 RepID=UPI001ADCF421|nr:hypothetical protein [Acinetobacter nosocomialis]MBO8213149.1 hypothetical protein [Acinetobacter nosocomialis]